MFIENAYASSSNDTITIQESENLPKAPPEAQSGWTNVGMVVQIALIFGVFYFLVLRPQEKRRRQQEDLVTGVKNGEEIVTTSGIFGKITKINDNDNTVELQIAQDTSIKILKTAISDIISRKKDIKDKSSNKKDKK